MSLTAHRLGFGRPPLSTSDQLVADVGEVVGVEGRQVDGAVSIAPDLAIGGSSVRSA